MLLLLRNIEQANAATVLPSLLHHMCVKALNGLTFFHNLIHTERIVDQIVYGIPTFSLFYT